MGGEPGVTDHNIPAYIRVYTSEYILALAIFKTRSDYTRVYIPAQGIFWLLARIYVV